MLSEMMPFSRWINKSEVLLPPDGHFLLPERLQYPEMKGAEVLQRAQLLECKHGKGVKPIRCQSRYTVRPEQPFQAARVP